MEIPRGLRTYIYEQSARKRWVEERLLNVFFRWGFQEIITPAFEYLDTFSTGLVLSEGEGINGESADSAVSLNRVFKFTERGTGRLLALRPDITPQIARTAATLLKDSPKPLRLCYCGNVFRGADPGTGESQEVYQAGVELIGLDSPEADAETIAIAVECMKELGLKGFKVAIGQIDFFKGMLSGIEPDMRREISLRIHKKDTSGLEDLLQRGKIEAEKRERIKKIPSLFGGREVIDMGRETADNPLSLSAIDNLECVYRTLVAYGVDDSVLIDLSEIRGFGYYTGIIFEGFIKGIGSEICGGGRYDNLIGRYGAKMTATGFAVDINRVIEALEKRGEAPALPCTTDYLVIDFRENKKIALEVARRLREKGFRVARDIIKRGLEGSLQYAEKMNIKKAIIMGTENLGEDEAAVREIATGEEKRVKIKELLN